MRSFNGSKYSLFSILKYGAGESCYEDAASMQLRLHFSERWMYWANIEKSKSPVAF